MNQDFINYVKDHIKEYLPPEYQDAVISIQKVTKNNDRTLTGFTIFQSGERAAPTVYLEPFAEQLKAGRSMDSVMRQIAKIQETYKGPLPIDVSIFERYEAVRPMLSIQMCNPKTNREYLEDKPYTLCGELAAFYRIQVAADHEGTASIAITDSLLRNWNITKDQLHKDAVQAENERNPVCFYDMDDVMSEIVSSKKPDNLFQQGEPLDIGFIPLYVLTNQNKENGAGVLARDGVLEKVGTLIGSNFYVLPSSVHEVLIVPDYGNMTLAELETTVREVNDTQVLPEERLSYKVQYYDREAKTLGRKQEKSVLGQLADKKAQLNQAEAAPKTKQAHRSETSL
ncbi:DUF5688 family protein [Enterocloster clostridioformis]|uniref:DUF5688 family protein n=1 Tax=Enterocloster clostridioformis TaxID=1531 RepID=UPI002675A7FC|nr:DUF5688 family protein [Enterocloster clostridioformis]